MTHFSDVSSNTRISDEIKQVKELLKKASDNIIDNDFNTAKHSLYKAYENSSCTYCKEKITSAIESLSESNIICSYDKQKCNENIQSVLVLLSALQDKMPLVESKLKEKENNTIEEVSFLKGPLDAINEMINALNELLWGWTKV